MVTLAAAVPFSVLLITLAAAVAGAMVVAGSVATAAGVGTAAVTVTVAGVAAVATPVDTDPTGVDVDDARELTTTASCGMTATGALTLAGARLVAGSVATAAAVGTAAVTATVAGVAAVATPVDTEPTGVDVDDAGELTTAALCDVTATGVLTLAGAELSVGKIEGTAGVVKINVDKARILTVF